MSLLPSTHSNNLKILRGIAKFAPKNSDGTKQSAIQLSPSSEFSISMSSDEATYESAESGVNEILDRTVIKVDRTRSMVEALKLAGGKPKYTEFPGVAHNSWFKAFDDPELLPWLFAQKRSP